MNEDQNENEVKSENEIADYYDGVRNLELQGYESDIKRQELHCLLRQHYY